MASAKPKPTPYLAPSTGLPGSDCRSWRSFLRATLAHHAL